MTNKSITFFAALAVTSCCVPTWAQAPLGAPPGGFPPPPQPIVQGGPPPANNPGFIPQADPIDNPPPEGAWQPIPVAPTPIQHNSIDFVAEDRIGGWSFGGGVYLMQPYFEANPAFTLIHGNSGIITQQFNLSQQTSAAPLAWIGYTLDNGLGLRTRWFEFSGTGHADVTLDGNTVVFGPSGGTLPLGTTSTAPAGSVINANSNLHINVYDLEATWQVDHDRWTLLAAGGVRYAYMSQFFQVVGSDNTGSVFATQTASHNFSGVGPTAAFEGRRKFGDHGFAFYGTARGSILFGNSTQNSGYGDVLPTTISGGNTQTCLMTIGEFELGAEWRRSFGRCSIFTQLGVMGQVWLGGGNASQGSSLTTVTGLSGSGDVMVGNTQGQSSGSFGFLGGVFRFGLTF